MLEVYKKWGQWGFFCVANRLGNIKTHYIVDIEAQRVGYTQKLLFFIFKFFAYYPIRIIGLVA